MEFTLRKAKIEDASGIALVHVESWKSTYRGIVPDLVLDDLNAEVRAKSWEQQIVASNFSIYVAEDASGIFGFAAGGAIRESVADYDAELGAIYLLAERQKQGAGRKLTQAVAEDSRSAGFQKMLVWVLEQNPAVSFYRHIGAIPVTRKLIEIGGVSLPEIALGWSSLDQLASSGSTSQ